MVVKLLNGATDSLQSTIKTAPWISCRRVRSIPTISWIALSFKRFCIQIAALKGIVWRLPIRRVVDWNNPIICDLKLFSMAEPILNLNEVVSSGPSKGLEASGGLPKSTDSSGDVSCSKNSTPSWHWYSDFGCSKLWPELCRSNSQAFTNWIQSWN